MKMYYMNGILEIEGHANGKDFPRFQKALCDLDRKALDNCHILKVFGDTTNNCTVPHFGHSALCGEPCKRDALPWGVMRYFNINLLIVGMPDLKNMPQAYRVNEHSQFIPCGFETTGFEESGSFRSLERIERQNP